MKDLQVVVESGTLQGIHGWDPRIAVFKGVPYAAPPVGERRFRVPAPPVPWEGVRMADHYGPIACQPVPGSNPDEFWTREIHPTGTEFAMSEDCLYLNIFTPARTGEEKLPVLIYIHGGGFKGGYPHEVEFDWEHMARKGLVAVAITYRLGVLGFLAHPWLSAEAPDEPKGNYGTMDQMAAIQWVRRNIAAFGGDPDKITIAGQSAGAMSVQNLMTSRLAKGLFHGAIIESGLIVSFGEKKDRIRPLDRAEAIGSDFFEKAGIKDLAEARAMSAAELLSLEDRLLGAGIHFEPAIDHLVLTESNFSAYMEDHHHRIPVMAGYTRGEAETFWKAFDKQIETMAEFREYAKGFGERAEEFMALAKVEDEEAVRQLFDRNAMLDMVAGARLFGSLQAAQGRKAYLYEFNADIPGDDQAGSYHGSEMWFAYDGLARSWRPFTGKHYDLARQISSYWANFVKNGDPNGTDSNGEDLPEWPYYSIDNEFLMEFTDRPVESTVKIDPLMRFRIDYTLKKSEKLSKLEKEDLPLNEISIKTGTVRFPTAPEFYGLFFEDINHAADGGLYPEMIRNRAFEDSLVPEGCTVDPQQRIFVTEYGWPGAFNHGEGMDEWAAAVAPTDIPGWYAEQATLTLLTAGTLNPNRQAALEVDFRPGGKIFNIGYCGVPIRAGEAYHFYCMIRADREISLTIALEAAEGNDLGSATIMVQKSDGYQRYDCDLTASGTDFNGRLTIVAPAGGLLVIGFTSLMPHLTFKGHGLREDLALALKNTHSRFIRFPGGCVVEGINEQNALRFSRTIGPVWERPSAQLMWHYRTTNGLGFHEYLQLCEDLEMEAMYVCNCGMSCQARHGGAFTEELTDEYLEEALHALEYALGSAETPYGRLRAENGHPEPFALKYVEIGNENYGPDYNRLYKRFLKALKAAFPQVIYISDGHTERENLPTEMVDEHYYAGPEFFLENAGLYDNYDRNGPQIFLGEYAVNGGSSLASMECALAEAAFLVGAEKNQDLVRLTAYAPLFQNADYTAWKPNMIVFNNQQVYGIPSYHAIALLGKYRGDEVVDIVCQSAGRPPVYRGIPGIACEKEGLLFKNAMVNGRPVDISRFIYGEAKQDGAAWRMMFGNRKHQYTGKSKEWNEAFGAFLAGGSIHDKPLIWVAFGTEELSEFTFEIEVQSTEDNPLTLSVWNQHLDTDAGCNEPRDREWTLRSVRNQVWRIAQGISAVRTPRYFDRPLAPEEQVPVTIPYGEYVRYKMVCHAYGYECYVNDRLIQAKKHALHPLLSAVATQDKEQIYLKIVNVGDSEQEVQIRSDCAVAEEVLTETVAAAPETVNSFAAPETVAVICGKIAGGSEFTYHAPSHSVNVLVMKKL